MLVAAHPSDLRAARDAGLKTAYVARPLEYGPISDLTGWKTANSMSPQRIFSTSPISWAPESRRSVEG